MYRDIIFIQSNLQKIIATPVAAMATVAVVKYNDAPLDVELRSGRCSKPKDKFLC
jgi:hypothetical protein